MKKTLFIISLLGLMLLAVSCGVNAMKPEEQVNKKYDTGTVTGSQTDVLATSPTNPYTVGAYANVIAVTYIKLADTKGTAPYAPITGVYKPANYTIDVNGDLIVTDTAFDGATDYVFKVYTETTTILETDVTLTSPTYEGTVLAGGTTTDYTLPAAVSGGNNTYILQWEDGAAYNNKWVSTGWTYPSPPSSMPLPAVSTPLAAEAGSAEGRKFRVWIYKN